MKVEQIYTKCLSQGSYYIESNNEAAIIDPIREIDTYIEKAKKNGIHNFYDVKGGYNSIKKARLDI